MKGCCCVVVADEGRARVFVVEDEAMLGHGRVPVLVERESFVDPMVRLPGRELVSEPMTGRGKGGPGGGVGMQSLDDRRGPRDREERRRHARTVADGLVEMLADEPRGGRVVLAASPKMLGALRDALGRVEQAGFEIVERAEDLTRLGAHDLHAHLAKQGLLPGRPTYHPPRN